MSDLCASEVGRLSLVAQLVADQAQKNPDAPALVASSGTIKYAELDRKSNQFAHYLRDLGVGPEKLVALSLERSPEMVIAALGILKAGGAYLPLDPSTPAERMHWMLGDAEASVLVTRKGSNGRAFGSTLLLDLDRDAGAIAACSPTMPTVTLNAKNLAYVIYTSGSTGEPKGVEVVHGGLSNLVRWHLRAFQVTSSDRASHQAALGFDAAVWEVWPYLAAGASVHFPANDVRNHPDALRHWLVAQRITITFLATPMAERMLLLDWPSTTALRVLLTGADTLHRRPPQGLPFQLINNYGPTECTVVATSGVVAPAEKDERAPTIGRPIDNTEIFVLDENMQPMLDGKPGELFVGGAGLARGYRNRPELTASRFVSNPLHGKSTDRLYRTGDLVRLRDDGEVEFLGRLDSQIKIRGYRIEPDEIVRAINSCPDIEASVVIAPENAAGEKRLVAYLVLVSGSKTTASALRDQLRKQLPDYMIPANFVKIAAVPFTNNGKVDVSALPAPQQANSLPDDTYVAPQTLVEQRLAGILAPLLHVERVGLHDNFFFMGGHSLLGTQLISKISENFGVELSLLSLFEHPTLAEMSEQIEQLILAKVEVIEASQVVLAPVRSVAGENA